MYQHEDSEARPGGDLSERVARNQAEREQLFREGAIRPYSQFSRFAYGSWWAFITAIIVVASFVALFAGGGGGVLWGLFIGPLLGFLSGRYTYRLWTWQARRLVFFIVF